MPEDKNNQSEADKFRAKMHMITYIVSRLENVRDMVGQLAAMEDDQGIMVLCSRLHWKLSQLCEIKNCKAELANIYNILNQVSGNEIDRKQAGKNGM